MKANQTVISLKEIRNFYKEECKKESKKYSEKEFEAFLKFLEIDFYDWVKENLRQFNK